MYLVTHGKHCVVTPTLFLGCTVAVTDASRGGWAWSMLIILTCCVQTHCKRTLGGSMLTSTEVLVQVFDVWLSRIRGPGALCVCDSEKEEIAFLMTL